MKKQSVNGRKRDAGVIEIYVGKEFTKNLPPFFIADLELKYIVEREKKT